jgi:hypothetical protein
MSYLYDKRGEPDDDLKALEDKLASARLPPPAVGWERQATRPPRWRWPALALAAGLAAAIVLLPRGPSFTVTTASGSSRLSVGGWLETTESADIAVADIGHVTVEPSSRVRLVETSKQRHRLELERGALHAKVAAPPRLFVVDTPAAQAVDLGCEYRLSVEPSGATRLEVLKGEVSLEGHGASSRVSAGAVCVTKKGEAPGVPRSVKSGAAFGQALDAWESHAGTLEPVLASAGRDDAVSLWNLLPRVDEAQRAQVVDKLVGVIEKPPKDLADADVVKLRAPAMESLWQSFP